MFGTTFRIFIATLKSGETIKGGQESSHMVSIIPTFPLVAALCGRRENKNSPSYTRDEQLCGVGGKGALHSAQSGLHINRGSLPSLSKTLEFLGKYDHLENNVFDADGYLMEADDDIESLPSTITQSRSDYVRREHLLRLQYARSCH
jgi:hypothetical protein